MSFKLLCESKFVRCLAQVVLICFNGLVAAHSQVAVYPLPAIYTLSPDFAVTVAPLRGAAPGAPTNAETVSFITGAKSVTQYDFAQFSFSGPVQVTITALSQKAIDSHTISPLALGVRDIVQGNTIKFTLDQPRYLIVKIDGLPELVLAADAAETDVPLRSDHRTFDITRAPYAAPQDGMPSSAVAVSKAIATAINDASTYAHDHGGIGVVYVPAGLFYIDNVVVKSNVKLYLAGGAVLRSSNDAARMSKTFVKTSQALDGTWLVSTAPGSHNISIAGRGMIDGDGYTFRNAMGLAGGNLIDTPLFLNNSTDVRIDGITIWNAGFWAAMVVRSNTVLVTNFKSLNALSVPGCKGGRECMYENDALDIVESSRILVKHMLAISQDDDYSTKTWGESRGMGGLNSSWGGSPMPIKDVLFTDVFGWSGYDAFKIGNGIYQPQAGIGFEHGYVYRAKHAIDIAPKYGTASTSNIYFRNIDIEATRSSWANFLPPSGPVTGVTFTAINIRDSKGDGALVQFPGPNPSHPTSTVSFDDISRDDHMVTSLQDLVGKGSQEGIVPLPTVTAPSPIASPRSMSTGPTTGVSAQAWTDPAHWRTVPEPIVTKNIVYYPKGAAGYTPSSQILDVFQQPNGKRSPVLVYMHGGAWRNGAKPEHWEPFRAWLDAGFTIVNVEYRLFDTVHDPAPAALQDVRCALSWVKQHAKEYGFDAGHVVTYGTSAGGHLALLSAVIDSVNYHDVPACADQPHIAAILDFYGPYHLEPTEPGAFTNPAVKLWMGPDPKPSLLSMEHEMSPSTYIRHGIPAVFLAHGDADPTVPYASSVQTQRDLEAVGVVNKLITVPKGTHGKWSPEENTRVQLESLKFLSKLGLTH